MKFYLHKILPIIFLPSGIIPLLILLGLLKRKPILIWIGLISFYLLSTPLVSEILFKNIENGHIIKDISKIPKADAIVVLGGMINYVKSETGGKNEWGDPDRFFGGIALYKSGKSNQLIFTGARMPWADKNQESEGESLKKIAIEMGVPDSVIKISGLVATTKDESIEVRKIIPKAQQILLVTSAYHMTRSKSLFEKQGFTVIPYPVDLKVSMRQKTLLDYLPHADNFRLSEIAFRELIGRAFYWLR